MAILSSRVASRRARVSAIAFLGLTVCVLWVKPMGLLLWARIRILTNIPRTAIADDVLARAFEVAGNEPRLALAQKVKLPLSSSRDPFALPKSDIRYDRNGESRSDRAGEAKSDTNSAE